MMPTHYRGSEMRMVPYSALLVSLVTSVLAGESGKLVHWPDLLSASDAVERTIEFLGIVESLDSKVDRLLETDFKAGCDLLKQAKAASGSEEYRHLVREAHTCFTKAKVTVEGSQKGGRVLQKGVSLLGLWHCHAALGDFAKARSGLGEITAMSDVPDKWVSFAARRLTPVAVGTEILSTYAPIIPGAHSAVSDGVLLLFANSDPFGAGVTLEQLRSVDPQFVEFTELQAAVREFLAGESTRVPDSLLR